MDDIYVDLENYNDVNAIEELRKENTELKFKLEDYQNKVDKLQKDYDKVSSEFKTLQINYSSLLKTARAEVERKTRIICNLNKEKDSLILASLQNTNTTLLNIKRNITSRDKTSKRKDNSKTDLECEKGKKNDVPDIKKYEAERDRGIENRLPSIDTASSGNTDDSNRLINVETKRPDPYTEKSADNKDFKVRSSVHGIRSRRKSTGLCKPFLNLSSDEEFEELYSAEEQKLWPSKDDNSRRISDKNKETHKVSETSGIDEKYSSYDEKYPRESYKGNPRFSDRYRSNRDKYEFSQRYKRRFSPAKHRRGPRDHSDDRCFKTDLGRTRVLESPPVERNRDNVKLRDRRSNHDRDPYDDRQKVLQERLATKHKIQGSDFEEPSNKRARIDASNRLLEEDKRKIPETAEPRLLPNEPNHLSCQSPDNTHETLPAPPVKEIKNTACTKLEDPRLTSSKYIVYKDDSKITGLCTVRGRNIQLISPTPWNKENMKSQAAVVERPAVLKRPPPSEPNISTKTVTTSIPDIENSASNMSIEDGEIQSNTPIPEDILKKMCPILNDYKRTNDTNAATRTSHNSATARTTENTKSEAKKYKIPKLKKGQEKIASPNIDNTANPLNFLMNELEAKCQKRNSPEYLAESSEFTKQKKEIVDDCKCISTETEKRVEKNIPKNITLSEIEKGKEKKRLKGVDATSEEENKAEKIRLKGIDATFSSEIEKKRLKGVDPTSEVEKKAEKVRLKEIDATSEAEKKSDKNKSKVMVASEIDQNLKSTDATSVAEKKSDKNKSKVMVASEIEKHLKSTDVISEAEKKTDKNKSKVIVASEIEKHLKDTDETLAAEKLAKKNKPKVIDATSKIEKPSEKRQSIDANSEIEKNAEDTPKEPLKLCISLRNLKCKPARSAREIVAGDLELSDETCDDAEMQSEINKHSFKLDKIQTEVEPSHDSLNVEKAKDDPYEKTAEISPKSSKKHKSKKKSHRQKELRSKDVPEIQTVSENQPTVRPEKKSGDKIQIKKAKFSELFGDSSSLITPEDLGLVTAHVVSDLPIFEDAQDAVDVDVEKIGKAQISLTESLIDNKPHTEPSNTFDEKAKSKPEKKSGCDSMKLKMNKCNEVQPDSTVEDLPINMEIPQSLNLLKSVKPLTPIEVVSPIHAEEMHISETPKLDNLIPELATKDSDVVKTVIISSGVQSGCPPAKELPNNIVKLIENIEKGDISKIQDSSIFALATSTPCKPLLSPMSDSRVDSSCSSNSRVVKNEASLNDQSSVSNSVEVRETEAPDVRIFVKRRRKMKK